MKKRVLVMTCCALTLFAQNVLAEQGEKPAMTIQEYPRIDGSLACVPLCEALAVEITGCSDYEAEDTMANFTNTNPCYKELKEGRTDIILAYEAAQETKDEIEGFEELNLIPVGKMPWYLLRMQIIRWNLSRHRKLMTSIQERLPTGRMLVETMLRLWYFPDLKRVEVRP